MTRNSAHRRLLLALVGVALLASRSVVGSQTSRDAFTVGIVTYLGPSRPVLMPIGHFNGTRWLAPHRERLPLFGANSEEEVSKLDVKRLPFEWLSAPVRQRWYVWQPSGPARPVRLVNAVSAEIDAGFAFALDPEIEQTPDKTWPDLDEYLDPDWFEGIALDTDHAATRFERLRRNTPEAARILAFARQALPPFVPPAWAAYDRRQIPGRLRLANGMTLMRLFRGADHRSRAAYYFDAIKHVEGTPQSGALILHFSGWVLTRPDGSLRLSRAQARITEPELVVNVTPHLMIRSGARMFWVASWSCYEAQQANIYEPVDAGVSIVLRSEGFGT
jgi:hypothetical protein